MSYIPDHLYPACRVRKLCLRHLINEKSPIKLWVLQTKIQEDKCTFIKYIESQNRGKIGISLPLFQKTIIETTDSRAVYPPPRLYLAVCSWKDIVTHPCVSIFCHEKTLRSGYLQSRLDKCPYQNKSIGYGPGFKYQKAFLHQ